LIATTLSFFIPGAGQFYNGNPGNGAIMLSAYVLSLFLLIVPLFGPVLIFGVWIWSITDAYKVAKRSSLARTSPDAQGSP
jgi:TM2 domain-containing membrane protein YozV